MTDSPKITILDKIPVVQSSTAIFNQSLPWIERGTRPFFRVTIALFSAGLATFALLYHVQSILPTLSNYFGVSAAQGSMTLSISTIFMSFGFLITGPISDAVGRKSIMVIGLVLASIFTLMSATMNSWHGILCMRALIGLSLSGVAAVGMTYLSEEIHPNFVPFSIGLYINGNSIGGMSGRLIVGVCTYLFSWRIAIVVIAFFSLAIAFIFWKVLPVSRHFNAVALRPRSIVMNLFLHFQDKILPLLFLEGFFLMGAFVTLFNYVGYRLMNRPWFLNQILISLLSLVYLVGLWSAPTASKISLRLGKSVVMMRGILAMLIGLLLTLFSSIYVVLTGIIIFTAGFFAAHSIASSWISIRAKQAKAQASSLYLFSYYIGSSIAGTLGGFFLHILGWMGIIIFVGFLLVLALFISWLLKCRVTTILIH